MYKLLIADDEALIRKGKKTLIPFEELGINAVYEAADGKSTLELVEKYRPDIVILDINMPQIDGLTVAEEIKSNYPETYIIMLTGYDYFEYMQKAIRAKVNDYILKPVSKKDIEHLLKLAIHQLDKLHREREIERISEYSEKELNGTDEIQEYLDEHMFQSDLSLHHMASAIGYNSNYLSVLIKERYGMSFQDYINKQRMERAKILLLSTNKKHYEIAEAIGIEDVNYFSTKFKKYYAMTPKQFRQGKQ